MWCGLLSTFSQSFCFLYARISLVCGPIFFRNLPFRVKLLSFCIHIFFIFQIPAIGLQFRIGAQVVQSFGSTSVDMRSLEAVLLVLLRLSLLIPIFSSRSSKSHTVIDLDLLRFIADIVDPVLSNEFAGVVLSVSLALSSFTPSLFRCHVP